MNPVGVPGALVFGGSGTGRIGDQFYKPWRLGFGPRLGLAYGLNSKTILRASGGIYYSDQSSRAAPIPPASRHPPVSAAANGFTSAYNWTTGSFPQNFNRPPQLIPEFQNNQSITWSLPDAMRLPQIMSWTDRYPARTGRRPGAGCLLHRQPFDAPGAEHRLQLRGPEIPVAGQSAAANRRIVRRRRRQRARAVPGFHELLAEHRGAGPHAVPAVHLGQTTAATRSAMHVSTRSR